MGLPVPSMPKPMAYGTVRRGGSVMFPTERTVSTCTQCGGPHEAHALACQWCLSPRPAEVEANRASVISNRVYESLMEQANLPAPIWR